MFEWIAKNAGARRALGEFILITNGDCVFTDELVAVIAQRRLRRDVFYSTIRRTFMTELPPVDLSVPPSAIVDFTQQRIHDTRPSELGGYFGAKAAHWRFAACDVARAGELDQEAPDVQRDFSRVLNFAPGDFFLLDRQRFLDFRGAPEVPQATGTDSAMIFTAVAHGLRQLVFLDPCTFLHQEHLTLVKYNAHTFDELDETYRRILALGRLANIRDPGAPCVPQRCNDENWGFGGIALPEVNLNSFSTSP